MKAIKLFIRFIKGNVTNLILVLFSFIFLNIIRSYVPLFIGKAFNILDSTTYNTRLPNFINTIFPEDNKYTAIIILVVCIFLVAVIRDLLNLMVDISVSRLSETMGFNVTVKYYDHVQNLPYSYLNHAETGDLIQRSTQDIYRVKRFIGGTLPNMLGSICILVIVSIQMFAINTVFTLIILAIMPVFFIISFIYFRSIQKNFTDMENEEGKMTNVLQENLTGIRVVKAFANEKFEIDKFNKALGGYTGFWNKINLKMSFFWGFADMQGFGLLLLSFSLGITFAVNNGMNTADILILFLYTQSLTWPARALARQISEFGKASISANRINEILAIKDEYGTKDGDLKPEITGDVVFDDVSFIFSDSKIPTLKNVNLTIKAGETLAIIGRTGSGKSTFVNLLNRMLEPTSGTVSINGYNIKDIDKKYLRKNVGIILQEPFLFSRTIKENISIALNDSNDDKIAELATIASVNDDIERFEKKYETMVGERGVTLSGGQKQRIAIARMLADEKRILVFDDSLSAVDTETDLKIRGALKKRHNKVTTIIITHRITTAKDADRIVVIEDGSISEVGVHKELIEKEGLYKKIWNIQNYFNDHPDNDELKEGENHV